MIVSFRNAKCVSRILHKSKLSVRVVKCVCVCVCAYNGVQMKSKLQNTGTSSSAARTLRPLCYRPAVFFLRLRVVALSFREEKNRSTFYLFIYILFKNCLILKLWNLILCVFGSVCVQYIKVNVKINFTSEQATTVQRISRVIALLFP